MSTRFQAKNVPGGRLTPSNLSTIGSSSTNSTFAPVSPSAYVSGETDQVYLGKIELMIDD
jgi:hypothetical protein